jgi:hypothetical protein
MMLPTSAWIELDVYDIKGELVESLENTYLAAGNYVYPINVNGKSRGTYFCQIKMNGVYVNSRKIILAR